MSVPRWLADYRDGDQVIFRVGRDGDQLIAEWIGLARLVAHRDGSSVRLEAEPGADARELKKIERGSATLLLRHLSGRLAFHGASVAHASRAVVLLGRSGDGKSTLAAWLCARAGATLFADDAVGLDEAPAQQPPSAGGARWLVRAAEDEHWLDDAARHALGLDAVRRTQDTDAVPAARGKSPVPATRPGHGVAALQAFVELAFTDGGSPRLTALHDVDALAALVPQAVRFVLDEPALYKRELDALTALVESVPVFRLERPRDLAHLATTGALVADLFDAHDRKGRQP